MEIKTDNKKQSFVPKKGGTKTIPQQEMGGAKDKKPSEQKPSNKGN